MALVPIAMGLGATAEQAAGIEAASWAPFVYGAYRYGTGSSNRNSGAAMSGSGYIPFTGGNLRKRHRNFSGAMGGRKKFVGPRKNIYRKPLKMRIQRPIMQQMNMGSEVVALHKLVSFDMTAGTDKFFCMQPADILTAPALARYTRLYDRMKFISLKLEFFATDYVTTAITSVSQSEKTTVSDTATILRQPSCRFHGLKRSDGINCSRSFQLANVAGLGDHIATASLSDANVVSTTNATQFDCGIHGAILHADAGYIGDQKINIKQVFLVQFMGQKQTMAAAALESGP
jgi:hypothetical protein